MKKKNQKWTSMVVAVMLFAFMTACDSGQQEQTVEEKGRMGMSEGMDGMDMARQGNAAAVNTEGEPAFVVAYMDLKDALVNDNSEQVKKEASDLQETLAGSELSEEKRSQLRESAGQVAEAQDIEAQRQAFAQLSQQLYEVVKNNDLTENTLYWQHCPMALKNQGANWLSYEQQVRNPFMGQRMPGCGSVQETL